MARSQMALQSSPLPKRTAGTGHRVLGLAVGADHCPRQGAQGCCLRKGHCNRGWEARKGTSMHMGKSDLPQAEVRARAKALRWGSAWFFYKTHG